MAEMTPAKDEQAGKTVPSKPKTKATVPPGESVRPGSRNTPKNTKFKHIDR